MSSISSTGAGEGLYQFFQSLSVNGQPSATTDTSATATDATSAATSTSVASDPTTDSTTSGQTVQGSGHHHRHHGGGGGSFFQKIQDAVSSALKSAQSDPTADPNKVVEDAIAKVFKENGVTPPTGNPPGATGQTGTPTANDPDGDGDTHGAGGTGSAGGAGSSAKAAFLQTLKSYGIDAQQFRSDFLAAIKDAQAGGTAGAATAFQSFPAGTTVDTTA